ncbi:MAG TPA: glutathione S-transferase family protein [Bordetella sp.]|nr:glutathione S-transferase family protein [Bordetella sp.]
MLILHSYPELFGLPDNNPFGLKVYAFLKLCGVPFEHRHVMDTSQAPRGQLPFVLDDGETIGDSDAIIAHVKRKYALTIDDALTAQQQDLDLMIRRTLDDLYWVMSYSRWRDDRYWPAFRQALLSTHKEIASEQLEAAREYNFKRYHYQGVGRYEPEQAYARGIANLSAIANRLADTDFVFGSQPTSTDAGIFGFVANIYFYDIDTPLKQFVLSRPELAGHCLAIRARVDGKAAA